MAKRTTRRDPIEAAAVSLPEHDADLIAMCVRSGLTVDELAYSNEFAQIHEALHRAGDPRSIQEHYRRLLNLRKSGRLSRVA